jgi:hypothetical protein
MTLPTPASTKVETWIFIRRARGTNDEGGEGAPQRCLHGVEVRPTTPTSPATAEIVARLSPGAHQTQRRCGLSVTLAEAVQALQHAATHNHRGRLHHSTSRREGPRQTHVPHHSSEKARTPEAAAPASSSPAERPSPETQTGRHLPQAVRGAAPTNRHRARRLGSHDPPRSQGHRPDQPASALETPAALARRMLGPTSPDRARKPRSGPRGRARGRQPPRPRRTPAIRQHAVEPRRPTAEKSHRSRRRDPLLARETARRRRKQGPAAAAPPGLCPAETTGDGKGGGGDGGRPVALGLGAARVAPGERATRGS